jgi:hypothetical protein
MRRIGHYADWQFFCGVQVQAVPHLQLGPHAHAVAGVWADLRD